MENETKKSSKAPFIIVLVIACIAIYFAISQGNEAKHLEDELKNAISSMTKETETIQNQLKAMTQERDALVEELAQERSRITAEMDRIREETIGKLPAELRAEYEALSSKVSGFNKLIDDFTASLSERLNHVSGAVADSGIIESIANFESKAQEAITGTQQQNTESETPKESEEESSPVEEAGK